MKLPGLLILTFAILSIQACRDKESPTRPGPYQHIEEEAARILLEKAINRAGGLEAWRSLKTLRFKKYTTLYDSTGATESEGWQDHDYTFYPEWRIRISWVEDSLLHEMAYNGKRVSKTIDGRADTTADQQALLNSIMSSTFVMSIPFKLLDESVQLAYIGTDTLENGPIVEAIRASYTLGQYDSHSTPDTWWHYFDKNDSRLLAYVVRHSDHFSYVKNLNFTTAGGFLLPAERESYRVDSRRNILYLRAKYRYTDYEVER
ncbi:MAG: hypothetical protein H6556_25705 [Lewinellaceae bacterium]|nr:hypothetical protein [Lewinellaceae bacterium]